MQAGENLDRVAMGVAGLDHDLGASGELDEIDARAPVDGGPGGENGVAPAGRDIDARAFADEIVAEPLDVDIGDDAAALRAAYERDLKPQLEHAIDVIKQTDMPLYNKWYAEDVVDRVALQAIIAGSDNGTPVLFLLEYRITSPKGAPIKLQSFRKDYIAKPSSGRAQIFFIGLRDAIDAEVFEAGKSKLKVVAQYAVGFDNINRADANRYKIPFTNTADWGKRSTNEIIRPIASATAAVSDPALPTFKNTSNG